MRGVVDKLTAMKTIIWLLTMAALFGAFSGFYWYGAAASDVPATGEPIILDRADVYFVYGPFAFLFAVISISHLIVAVMEYRRGKN